MFILRAKYLFPVPEKAIENGALAIDESKIVSVGKYPDVHRERSCNVIDLGESVILPGLINAHAHLELTSLHGTIKPTKSFTNWITKVIRTRLSWNEEELNNSVHDGIIMSVESGTTTLADISTTGHAFQKLLDSPLRKTIFHEVIDFNHSTAETTAQDARGKITNFLKSPLPPFNKGGKGGDLLKRGRGNLLTIGISPHAPYTVSEELYRKCWALSRELNIPICTHIAETKDEIEFLIRGSGSFTSLLKAQNMLDSRWHPPGLLPVEYLNNVGFLKKGRGGVTPPLLIHCNYLSDKEISIIKESGASVVFCPRSHQFFGHENHPFRKLLSRGINVALGTDSLASNSSLSILDEMRFLYERYPDLKPQQILSMATINGAVALGIEDKVGRLARGFDADITVIEVESGNPPQPPFVKGGNRGIYERLFSQDSKNILTIVAGQVCYDRSSEFGVRSSELFRNPQSTIHEVFKRSHYKFKPSWYPSCTAS